MDYKLEPSNQQIQQMLEMTSARIVDYLEDIASAQAFDLEQTKSVALQQEPLPETETALEEILEDLFQNKIPQSLPTAHPGFMAYIPGGGLFHSALAELIAKVANRYVGINFTAPLLTQIEVDVLKWFCNMVGYPAESAGTLTSGGSIANLTAVICARTLIMGDNFTKGTVYTSSFSHHSNRKAFLAAGISQQQIRQIAVDKNYRMDVILLQQSIEEDIANGFTPLMIIATAGSTNTGTIDPLEDIAEIAQKVNAWYHIDAAYGGFFAMIESGKKLLKGIELADSITLDPHKGLFLPYGTGAIIVRDRENLKKVFGFEADYINDTESDPDLWNFSEMSLELTRPFRGLAIWLPFKMLGAGTFRAALEEKFALANYFHDKLLDSGRWQIIVAPVLSLTVFRYQNSELNKKTLNAINNKILAFVNRQFRVNLSGTIINGDFVLRCCILSFRTHQTHVDWLLEDLQQALDTVIIDHSL